MVALMGLDCGGVAACRKPPHVRRLPAGIPPGQHRRMRLHHVALIVSDLEAAAAFYEGVLGLVRDVRPDLGFPGIFYALDGGAQIHLMRIDDPYAGISRPTHGGQDRHLALAVEDVAAIRARLDAAGLAYTPSRSGRAALFCRDPDGNTIELFQP
jgi:glyoxylase I family protein